VLRTGRVVADWALRYIIGYNVPFLSFQLSFTRAPRFSSRLQAPETPNRRQSLLWELGIYIVLKLWDNWWIAGIGGSR